LLFSLESFVFPNPVKKTKIKVHNTVTSHGALYGCETWSLAPMEEHGLRVFEDNAEDKWP